MSRYRKTQRRRSRASPPYKVRLKGSRVRVDLRRLPWWHDPVVLRILDGRRS
jgi:hypothetical protein